MLIASPSNISSALSAGYSCSMAEGKLSYGNIGEPRNYGRVRATREPMALKYLRGDCAVYSKENVKMFEADGLTFGITATAQRRFNHEGHEEHEERHNDWVLLLTAYSTTENTESTENGNVNSNGSVFVINGLTKTETAFIHRLHRLGSSFAELSKFYPSFPKLSQACAQRRSQILRNRSPNLTLRLL